MLCETILAAPIVLKGFAVNTAYRLQLDSNLLGFRLFRNLSANLHLLLEETSKYKYLQ